MKNLGAPTFPPVGPWDPRMREAACMDLVPVRTVHENPWFAVRDRAGHFTVDYHDPQVTVLPVVGGDSLVMVRVKRPVLCDCPLEFPGGTGRPNEAPDAIASRELLEETGIAVADLGRFKPMAPVCASSTRMPRLIYVYRVDITRDEFDKRRPHDDEIDEVVQIDPGNLNALLADGGIYVSVPLAIIARFLASKANHKV
jgi:8-oxo-dGTP pyrophosphatase MutT (NUDIX family)